MLIRVDLAPLYVHVSDDSTEEEIQRAGRNVFADCLLCGEIEIDSIDSESNILERMGV